MGRLPIDCCTEPAIFFGSYHHVQEGHGSIWLGVLTGELNVRVYGVNVLQELLLMGCLDDYTSVIYKPLPHQRGCGDVVMTLT